MRILECHVNFTELNYKVPAFKRSKFLGLCDDEMLAHYELLRIDTIQIMPVFDCLETAWGYDTTSWTELNPKYGTLGEFKEMIDTLQAHGINVVLDCVFNHTACPIDGVTYGDDDHNFSGCGGTVIVNRSLPVIMSSIDYWLGIVDGIRFDLANVLGREDQNGFNPNAEFFKLMEKHSDKILIAEPWDCDEYSLGRYPSNWFELNGKFRDCVKKGNEYVNYDVPKERSINFVTCHDGLTMYDLIDKIQWFGGTNESMEGHKAWLNKQLDESEHCLILAGDYMDHSQNGDGNPYMKGFPVKWK
jgi:isoamylase